MKTTSMSDLSTRLRNAHSSVSDKRLAVSADQLGDVSACYRDILSDLETLRGEMSKIGCPRSEDLVKKLIRDCEAMKPTMEEELAKPV